MTLDEQIWFEFQQYPLPKHGNERNKNTELELDMTAHMKNNPIKGVKVKK